ncbi:MAG: hypothetical protein AAGC64_10825 [Bacteroidota bacterium]
MTRHKTLIAGLVWMLSTSILLAHNPLTARFELKASLKEGALLHVYLTQLGVHNALVKQHPDVDFKSLELNAYKKLVVSYIRKHVCLKADEVNLELGYGAIKLGNHQTDLRFYVKKYPEKVKSLAVEIDAFKENGNQQTVFWWYTTEAATKVILSSENGFKGHFNTKEKQKPIEEFSSQQAGITAKPTSMLTTIGVLIGIIICAFSLTRISRHSTA